MQDIPQSSTSQLAGAAEGETAPGRNRRSRKDRPCDTCRRHKHLCTIPVKGEPCAACSARSRPCTFTIAPTQRVRKPAVTGVQVAPGERVVDAIPPAESETSAITPFPAPHVSFAPSVAMPFASSASTARPFQASHTPQGSPAFAPQGTARGLAGIFRELRTLRLQEDGIIDRVPPETGLQTGDDPPLDLEDGDEQSHFLSSGAFSDLTLTEKESHQSASPISFRQISNDSRTPVFFVRNPNPLLYGKAQAAGRDFYFKVCGLLGSEWPPKLYEIFRKVSLPALPIINGARLDAAFDNPEGIGSNPYALFGSLLAHCTTYVPDIRQHHKQLWGQVLLSLEEEYRQPRLQTLQLALIILSSRPPVNAGQNTIAMARVLGAAQLLGLHMDPSRWRLPKWERSLRKRIWWCLIVHDKFRALGYGRPSNAHSSNYNVPVPTLSDVDSDQPLSGADLDSMKAFIATCQLTVILDNILSEFFTVHAAQLSSSARLKVLEGISADLEAFSSALPRCLFIPNNGSGMAGAPSATGVRSFQLSQMGINVVLMRLTIESIDATARSQLAATLHAAFSVCSSLVGFVESLTPTECSLFWMPYSSLHVSNTVSLILRTALRSKAVNPDLRTSCSTLLSRLLISLTAHHYASSWDVASHALDRIATLLESVQRELPEMAPLLLIFSPLQPTTSEPLAGESPGGEFDTMGDEMFASGNGDPLWWMSTGIATMPDGFGGILSGVGEDAWMGFSGQG